MPRTRDTTLYDSDVLAWSGEQGDALARLAAAGDSSGVDWHNVIRTIRHVGDEELGRVHDSVSTILGNAQRGYADPDSPHRASWMLASLRAQLTLARQATASARRRLDLDRIWSEVFDAAAADLRSDLIAGIPPGLPARCPFTWADLLDERFTYEEAVRRLYEAVTVAAESADP